MKTANDDTLCSRCLEGFIVGDRVYCGIDNCFRPSVGNLRCEAFNPKNHAVITWGDIVVPWHNIKNEVH